MYMLPSKKFSAVLLVSFLQLSYCYFLPLKSLWNPLHWALLHPNALILSRKPLKKQYLFFRAFCHAIIQIVFDGLTSLFEIMSFQERYVVHVTIKLKSVSLRSWLRVDLKVNENEIACQRVELSILGRLRFFCLIYHFLKIITLIKTRGTRILSENLS